MNQQQHTQEPVAYFQVEYHGGMPLHQQVGSQHKGEPGVFPLYALPPDAAARIAELEKQRDTLLAAAQQAANEIRKCDYTPARSTLLTAIASVKEKA